MNLETTKYLYDVLLWFMAPSYNPYNLEVKLGTHTYAYIMGGDPLLGPPERWDGEPWPPDWDNVGDD